MVSIQFITLRSVKELCPLGNFCDILTVVVYKVINKSTQSSVCYLFKIDSEIRDYSFRAYAKFSKKTNISYSWYAHLRVLISGQEILVFWENFTYVLNEWSFTQNNVCNLAKVKNEHLFEHYVTFDPSSRRSDLSNVFIVNLEPFFWAECISKLALTVYGSMSRLSV